MAINCTGENVKKKSSEDQTQCPLMRMANI